MNESIKSLGELIEELCDYSLNVPAEILSYDLMIESVLYLNSNDDGKAYKVNGY